MATCLQEMDPEGCERRRRQKLKRRVYTNPGPNYCWHIDGYDKIKADGFAIHGCIDGYSRKLIWLKLDRTNNDPLVIGRYYIDAVKEYGGCPLKVRTDCGTENGLVAASQCYFIGDDLAHIYGTLPLNQRIEGWWSYLRQHRTTWWIDFFQDLMEQQVFTPGNELQMECLWFYLPELQDTEDFLAPVSAQQCDYIKENYLALAESTNDYQEYFNYAFEAAGLSSPKNWREALDLYHTLYTYASNSLFQCRTQLP